MLKEVQGRVEAFMRNAGQDVPEKPVVPDEATLLLRARLILEEANETYEGLGYRVVDGKLIRGGAVSLTEIADGCCDLMVVALGTMSACGIDASSVMAEVLRSNDSKFIDGRRGADGKWLKGPSYSPADVAGVLRGQANG